MTNKVKNYLFYLLGRREYSRKELTDKATYKYRDINVESLNLILDEFVNSGWQSDTRFAGSFLRSKIQQNKGLRLIRYELINKGISESIISTAIDEEPVDWIKLAELQIQKKIAVEDLKNPLIRQKIYQFLTRKGFEGYEIEKSIQNLRCD